MARGRKPTPSATKRLRGNPGKRKLNQLEPAFEVAIPDPPPHLDEIALTEWNLITQELAAKQVITQVDKAILALYCETWSEWIMLGELLKEQATIKTYPTGAEYVNLLIGARRSARQELKNYAAELGITPSSRTKVKTIGKAAEEPSKKQALAEKLFKLPVSK
jgi:P27 family predicted phage terminase small subunit